MLVHLCGRRFVSSSLEYLCTIELLFSKMVLISSCAVVVYFVFRFGGLTAGEGKPACNDFLWHLPRNDGADPPR